MPDLSKYSVRDALIILTKLGIKYKLTGSGFVVTQSINPGEKIQKGLTCRLTCEETKLNGAVVY
jgi:cell division protein FtsI (penicillin-binding protein 3)